MAAGVCSISYGCSSWQSSVIPLASVLFWVTYVTHKELRKNTEMYVSTLISYIDKGIPVISWGNKAAYFSVFVALQLVALVARAQTYAVWQHHRSNSSGFMDSNLPLSISSAHARNAFASCCLFPEIKRRKMEMIYTSLEQRAAQGYLDLFPQFVPDEQALRI